MTPKKRARAIAALEVRIATGIVDLLYKQRPHNALISCGTAAYHGDAHTRVRVVKLRDGARKDKNA